MDRMLQTAPANTSVSPARSVCVFNGKPLNPDETYNTIAGNAWIPANQGPRTARLHNGNRLRRGRQRRASVGADALDHGTKAVRALRREMLPQAEAFEQLDRIEPQDVLRALARIHGE